MSEKTEIPPLHVAAFAVSMIAGPLLFTALTFWVALIPVYALAFGGIPYLVIGTPIALWMALYGPVTIERALKWSGLTILFFTAAGSLIAALTNSGEWVPAVLAIGVFSAFFGMAWSATTGWLYAAMTNEKAV
jgi:hypothetical protein